MKNSFRTVLFLSAALVAAGCNSGKSAKTAPAAEDLQGGEKVVLINTAQAQTMEIIHSEVYSATVQANAVNNIAPQTGGRIQKLNVEVGDFVSKGQILAEMDRLQLDQTKLKLTNDSTELSRVRQLLAEGAVAQADFETLEMAYKVSKSTYNNLLENTILRSPISGVVTARNYDKGDMFGMTMPLYVVQEITPVKILVGISESDYTKVKKGDVVKITADAIPGREFQGRVNRIYPVMDAASHTFTAEVIVGNADRAVRPGMYVKVEVTFGVSDSVVVPDDAVVKQQGSGQRAVFVVNSDNTVTSRIVKVGKHFGTTYEIVEGLSEGETVATKGSNSLRSGSKIQIAD